MFDLVSSILEGTWACIVYVNLYTEEYIVMSKAILHAVHGSITVIYFDDKDTLNDYLCTGSHLSIYDGCSFPILEVAKIDKGFIVAMSDSDADCYDSGDHGYLDANLIAVLKSESEIVFEDGVTGAIWLAPNLIMHRIEDACLVKEEFGDEYDMYVGYCSQWDSNEVKVEPISRERYMAIDVRSRS